MDIDYSLCVQHLYPDAVFGRDFAFQDNGNGVYISLWDEDKLGQRPNLGLLEEQWLDVKKALAKERIKQTLKIITEGPSPAGYNIMGLGEKNFEIDATRNDLSNLQNLHMFMERQNIPQTVVRGFDNQFHIVTEDELDQIIMELIAYGLWCYQHKWEKEVEIDAQTTVEGVDAVEW